MKFEIENTDQDLARATKMMTLVANEQLRILQELERHENLPDSNESLMLRYNLTLCESLGAQLVEDYYRTYDPAFLEELVKLKKEIALSGNLNDYRKNS